MQALSTTGFVDPYQVLPSVSLLFPLKESAYSDLTSTVLSNVLSIVH